MTTTITVDYEHNCEKWWTNARLEALGNPPSACVGLLDSVNNMTASDEHAVLFIQWASKIEGWDESPFVITTGATDEDLETLIWEVVEANLTNAEIVCDFVRAAAREGGLEAGRQELARAIANETK